MPNPTIAYIQVPDGTIYDIKDAFAREAIASNITYVGVTTTALTDQATTNPIQINGESYTATKGDLVVYNHKEFLFDGTKWDELGDLTGLGSLAYKDSASGSYTPAGSISQPTFTGSNLTSSGKFTPSGTVSVSTDTTENKTATVAPAQSGESTYTPAGSVEAPTISVETAGETTTVNSITAVGTLPELTTTVANEVLTIGWSAGTLPTKGSDTTVKVSDASYQASAPAFTGTAVRLVTDDIAVPSTYTATFTGTEDNIQVDGTPSGTVSQPTFTGTTETITVT